MLNLRTVLSHRLSGSQVNLSLRTRYPYLHVVPVPPSVSIFRRSHAATGFRVVIPIDLIAAPLHRNGGCPHPWSLVGIGTPEPALLVRGGDPVTTRTFGTRVRSRRTQSGIAPGPTRSRARSSAVSLWREPTFSHAWANHSLRTR